MFIYLGKGNWKDQAVKTVQYSELQYKIKSVQYNSYQYSTARVLIIILTAK